MKTKLEVGDVIFVEQAWEDETGAYHDEYATIKKIDKKRRLSLEFDHKIITDFLSEAEFFEKDYLNCVEINK